MSIPGAASPLFIGAAAAEAGPYQIDRSLRFNANDGAKLTQTFSSAGNRRTFTYSCWVKRTQVDIHGTLFARTSSQSDRFVLAFFNDELYFFSAVSGTTVINVNTSNFVLRDPSAWYHLVFVWDTTQSTANDRTKFYVNGVQVTDVSYSNQPSLNYEAFINTAAEHTIGHENLDTDQNLNGYLAETHFIDGQALAASDFGEYDDNNVWQPKAYSGSYGTNGFKLDFSDNTSTTTIAEDSSGNNNDFTANNISVASGAGNDSLVDSPTNGTQTDTGVGGEVVGNYCTLNPLDYGSRSTSIFANGNLEVSNLNGSSADSLYRATIGASSGKWYFEVFFTTMYATEAWVGIAKGSDSFTLNTSTNPYYNGSLVTRLYRANGNKSDGSESSYGASWSTNDIIGVALDLDAGTLTFYKNGSSQGSAFTGITGTWFPTVLNGGGNSSLIVNFGQRPFTYTAPTGFKSLCTANLPDPTIADGSTVFDAKIWNGDGTDPRSITTSFSPDLVWIKARNATNWHNLTDSVRGVPNRLFSNDTSTEDTVPVYGQIDSLDSNGFTLGGGTDSGNPLADVNQSGSTYVGWAWDAGTSTVSNTDGSITSNVRANASAGFSIVSYSGNSTVGATVGHGLNVAPAVYILKNRSASADWIVLTSVIDGSHDILYLNLDSAKADTTLSLPTSSVIQVGSVLEGNKSGDNYIAYCFAPVAGFSAMGAYEGNGDADGPFVFTGFRPRWVMWKKTSGASQWALFDTARNPNNLADLKLEPNRDVVDQTQTSTNEPIDILSNGFKLKGTGGDGNASGADYFWIAFAEHPFKTARAR